MGDLLAESLKPAVMGANGFYNPESGGGSEEGRYIDWLPIKDQTQSIIEDVARIRHHPLVPAYIPIYGYLYDVKTGRLIEIPEATAVGAAPS